MGVIIYSLNLNISLKCHMVCLSVILLCYRMTYLRFYNKRFCNKKGVLFVPGPVYAYMFKNLLIQDITGISPKFYFIKIRCIFIFIC